MRIVAYPSGWPIPPGLHVWSGLATAFSHVDEALRCAGRGLPPGRTVTHHVASMQVLVVELTGARPGSGALMRLTVVGGSILSGLALILLGIAILAGGMYFYRRAANLRAIMPATITWGSGLLLVQGFLKYVGVLLAVSGHPVTQGPVEVT